MKVNKEQALCALDEAIEGIKLNINNPDYNKQELVQYLKIMELMKAHVLSNSVPESEADRDFGAGRQIMDSWEFQDRLGQCIVTAEQFYKVYDEE